MTLTELLSLNPSLTVPYLQAAYDDAVRKVRLHACAFPVKITGACRIDGFAAMATVVGTGSQVAVKQLCSVEGASLDDSFDDSYTVAVLEIGTDDPDTDYGFDGFDAVNDDHATTPSVHWTGADLVCTNLDVAFLWLTCYAYPYFVTYGTPYDREHRYDIQWMADTYGAGSLTVDPVLLYPVGERALSIARQNAGDITSAASLDAMATALITMHDRNPEFHGADLEPGKGLAGGSIL